jgi:hypothetical protein
MRRSKEVMDCRCPRKLNALPKEPCQLGREAVNLAKKGQEGGCPWFVSDQESNYCFFKFMQDDSRPVPPQKIAQKLLIDDSEVKKIINNFKKKSAELLEKSKSPKKS